MTEYLFLRYNMVWYKKISLSQAEGGEIEVHELVTRFREKKLIGTEGDKRFPHAIPNRIG